MTLSKYRENKIAEAKKNGDVGYFIVMDTFDYEDYLVIIKKNDNIGDLKKKYDTNMQRIVSTVYFN